TEPHSSPTRRSADLPGGRCYPPSGTGATGHLAAAASALAAPDRTGVVPDGRSQRSRGAARHRAWPARLSRRQRECELAPPAERRSEEHTSELQSREK